MKRFLIATVAAAAAVVGASSFASAASYPPAPSVLGVSGTAPACPTGNSPLLDYEVQLNFTPTSAITLTFLDGASVVDTASVSQTAGRIVYPGGSNGQWPGWSQNSQGEWIRDASAPNLVIRASTVVEGATVTAQAAVTYPSQDACVEHAAAPPAPAAPVPVAPATPVPPPAALPTTGLSTFETALRMGALLLIGGLAFVIAARRRRYAPSAATA